MSIAEGQGPTWRAVDISFEQSDFATGLRIPFLRTPYPEWAFVIAVVVDGSQGVAPTEEEVAVLAAHLQQYKQCCYSGEFRRRMERFAPYDMDRSANLGVFMKRPDGSWFWRKRSWRDGPTWLPEPGSTPMTLAEVIAKSQPFSDRLGQ